MELINSLLQKPKPTIQYFQETNWQLPEKLTLEIYSLSVVSDFRRMNYFQITEIFIPEYNIGINNYNKNSKGYNINMDASDRFLNKTQILRDNFKPPNLLKTIVLNENDPTLKPLFEIISSYVKSQNKIPEINELFN